MNPSEVIVETGPWEPVEFSPAEFQAKLLSDFERDSFRKSSITEGFARVCDHSYESQEALRASILQLGFEDVDFIPKDDMFCCLAIKRECLVVAFRGTDSWKDVLFNVDIRRLKIDGGHVHNGFQQAYLFLKDKLLDKIRSLAPKQLWITGHSLGGAMALLCGYDLAINSNHAVTGVVTFGQPMLCKEDLADAVETALGGQYLRLVNNQDRVTRVPPGYVHCGQLIWWHGGQVLEKFNTGWIKGLVAGGVHPSAYPDLVPMDEKEFKDFKEEVSSPIETTVMEGRFLGRFFPGIDDHRMTSYLDQIRVQ